MIWVRFQIIMQLFTQWQSMVRHSPNPFLLLNTGIFLLSLKLGMTLDQVQSSEIYMKTINVTSRSNTLKTHVKCPTFILVSPSLSECRKSHWKTQVLENGRGFFLNFFIRTTTWEAIHQISN